jgi:hypothetical protein
MRFLFVLIVVHVQLHVVQSGTDTLSVIPMVAAAGNKCEGEDMKAAEDKAQKKNEEEIRKKSSKRWGPQLKYKIDDKGVPQKISDEPVEKTESEKCACHDSFALADGQSCVVCKGKAGAETVKSGPAECAKKTSPKEEPKKEEPKKDEKKDQKDQGGDKKEEPKKDEKKEGGEPPKAEPPKKEEKKQDEKKDEKPWWWDQLYGKDKPTEAPKCTEDSITVSPSTIKKGEAATISWDVTGKGTIKTIINFTTTDERGAPEKGSLGVVDGGSVDVSPERTATYTVKVANEIGTTVCKPPVKVFVKPADDDSDTITPDDEDRVSKRNKVLVNCDPAAIRAGETATVSWSCTAVTGSSFGTSTEDGSFSTGGSTEGSVDVTPLRDATYVVRCRDKFGKEFARKSCRISVAGGETNTVFTGIGDKKDASTPQSSSRPSVRLTAEPQRASKGTSVKVGWKSQHTASCVIYGPGCDTYGKDSPKCFKEVGRSGYIIGTLHETSLFRAECLAPDRRTKAVDTLTVEISDDEEESDE